MCLRKREEEGFLMMVGIEPVPLSMI